MSTLANKILEEVTAINLHFDGNILSVMLSDGREIRISIDRIEWLDWLTKTTPEQRNRWSLEPGGFAIYWDNLDDGIEIRHLVGMQPFN